MAQCSPDLVQEVIQDARSAFKTPKAQIRYLEDRLRTTSLAVKTALLESYTIQFGGAATTTDFATEDPRFDDGVEPWNEIGLNGRVPSNLARPRVMQDYDRARDIGRALAQANGYAIGVHCARQDYLVGSGIGWHMVAKDQEAEDEGLTEDANDAIEAFKKANNWLCRELELVLRGDRDGEAFLRLFMNADGPIQVRWVEPEHVRPPTNDPARAPFGVEFDGRDAEKVRRYFVLEDPQGYNPTPVVAMSRADAGDGPIPHMLHWKPRVDSSWVRGWALMWASRKALTRCEKTKANMNYTAALQAAIALIRKHEATSAEVQTFLDDGDDLKATNNVTGKSVNYTGIQPGTIIDSGAGITYEAPISSVNAAQNVPAVDLELRGIAAQLCMPEFLFSGKMDSGFANSLVGETPWIKHVQREQAVLGEFLHKVVWAAVQHEVFWGRLPKRVLTDYRLQPAFPDPQIRQPLPMAQTHQIMHTAGVLSTRTWQERAGLDPEVEKRNGAAPQAAQTGEKPPAGSTPDGPGGADMKGNEDPKTSPQNVAFSPEE